MEGWRTMGGVLDRQGHTYGSQIPEGWMLGGLPGWLEFTLLSYLQGDQDPGRVWSWGPSGEWVSQACLPSASASSSLREWWPGLRDSLMRWWLCHGVGGTQRSSKTQSPELKGPGEGTKPERSVIS